MSNFDVNSVLEALLTFLAHEVQVAAEAHLHEFQALQQMGYWIVSEIESQPCA